VLYVFISLVSLSGCGTLPQEHLLYDQQGVRVGIQTDPTIGRGSPTRNSHPARISPQDLRQLLSALQVSGWSGTVVGLFESPRPVALFDDAELSDLSSPASLAFQQAGPDERVFFTLANRKIPYSDDRTSGALFIRETYLHVVVTDHRAYTRADTAGGNEKDPRDTKGMKLWVTRPYQAAVVPPEKEPKWAPFETVHLSLNMSDLLISRRSERAKDPRVNLPRESSAAPSVDDLQLQIRELTQSNLELRKRLEEQSRQMNDLKLELESVQREQAGLKRQTPSTTQPSSP
jgi:hypothetical protein